MRTILLLTVLAVALAVASIQSTDAKAAPSALAQFVGNYELVKYQRFREDGEVVDLVYAGRIMYDAAGNMSAQGVDRALADREYDPNERPRGSFAYFGTVTVKEDEGVIIHRVKGSPTRPPWAGADNVRYYEFTDGFLKLSLKNDEGRVTGTLTWNRID